MSDILNTALSAALEAGERILEIYDREFSVVQKEDLSPLTEADEASNRIIMTRLKSTSLPVLSEESNTVPYGERSQWKRYWLVDPLDGTKEFIKKNGEFTVNIALIEGGKPVLGVVYAPVLQTVYYGVKEGNVKRGAWKAVECAGKSLDELISSAFSLPVRQTTPSAAHRGVRVVASRSHCNEETLLFIEGLEAEYGCVELVSSGSSLKLCMVADGSADIYPRIAPTMEWDTAAAQAVVEAAGGRVVQYDPSISAPMYSTYLTKLEPCPRLHALSYNKENLLNPAFVVVCGSSQKGQIK